MAVCTSPANPIPMPTLYPHVKKLDSHFENMVLGGNKERGGSAVDTRTNQGILTKNKRKVVKSLLLTTPGETAKQFGVKPGSISRFKSRDDIKEMIQKERERIALLSPGAVNLYRKVIEKADRIVNQDNSDIDPKQRSVDAKYVDMGLRAGERVGQAVGLFPSHLQINTNLFLTDSPCLSPILQSLLSSCVPSIDITPPPFGGSGSTDGEGGDD